MLQGAAEQPTAVSNRRELSRDEGDILASAKEWPSKLDVVKDRVEVERRRVEEGGKVFTKTSDYKVRSRKNNLTARAVEFAGLLAGNPKKIKSFFAVANQNRP